MLKIKLQEMDIPFYVYPRKDAGRKFYYRVLYEEFNIHKSCKTHDLESAINVARIQVRKLRGIEIVEKEESFADRLLLRSAVAEFIRARTFVVKPSTLSYIQRFFNWLVQDLGFIRLTELTPTILMAHLVGLNDKLNPSPSYWRDVLCRYNQFFNWCIDAEKMIKNPLKGFPRPKVWQIIPCEVVWEHEELEALVAVLPEEIRVAILVLRYTGIYPLDLYSIRKKNFIREKGVLKLILKRAKSQSDKQYFRVPLDGRIEDLVEAYYAKAQLLDDKVFVIEHPASYRAWYNQLQKEIKKAWKGTLGTENKPMKALRHTFATEHIERGVPEDVVLIWMGLSPGSTILRKHYLHRKETTRYRWTGNGSR